MSDAGSPEAAGQRLRAQGENLRLNGRYDEMLALADAILAAQPGMSEAWLVRGDALKSQDRSEAALEAYRTAGESPRISFDAHVRCGLVLDALGRLDEAFAAFDAALALRPDAPVPRFGRGLLRLHQRDFAAGWDDYEDRWRSDLFIAGSRGVVPAGLAPHLATRVPAAELAGRRVLVIGEQGVGDQLMFASMIPDLARIASSVVCVCDPRLVRLLGAAFGPAFGNVTVTDPNGGNVEADLALSLGSLAFAFRPTEADFPGTAYLRPRPEVSARWAERLGPRRARRRVGISWRGGTPGTRQKNRSLHLDQLALVLATPDCEFVNLQYGDVTREVAAANAGRAEPIRAFPAAEIDDFEDLAGLVASLDAVVSVQTSVVHMAGALGQTCLALLPHRAEWRYTGAGETMPWYGSVRLFRQAEAGAWEPVVAHAAAALAAL
jgi:tetratricopeptide (TPR) repeat protein